MSFVRKNLLRLILLAGLISAIFCFVQRSSTALAGGSEFVPNEVVVKLKSTADLTGVAAQFGVSAIPLDQFGSRPIYRLRITDGTDAQQKASQLLSDPQLRVVYAEPNYLFNPPEANRESWSVGDSFSAGADANAYKSQWATQTIKLPVAQSVTRGAGITVAVLDTGVDLTHPALAGRLVQGYDFVDMDTNPSEVGSQQLGPYGHGTHVAGIIALVAPDAKIMPIRVLDQNGVGNIWVLAEALAYAADPDGNPATHDGADVINLSLGTLRRTNLLSSVLARVSSDSPIPGDDDFPSIGNPNIVVVAAAGNTGDTTQVYPAAENTAGLIAVGASTQNDSLATFSTRGSWIAVLAPGDMIISSVPGGQYGTWRGTSMSAPFVAGEAALVRAAFPGLRQAKIISHIVSNAARVETPIQARADAGKAVTTTPELETSPTPTASPTPVASPSPVASPTASPSPSPTGSAAIVQFSAASMSVSENDPLHAVTVTVNRTGDTTIASTVLYFTSDQSGGLECDRVTGQASQRCDYTATGGMIKFREGETTKTVLVPIVNDGYVEGSEVFTIQLQSVNRATIGAIGQATITILDSGLSTVPANNPYLDDRFFVRQNYLDFLSREPDDDGYRGWTGVLSNCGPEHGFLGSAPDCDRAHVSHGFFASKEFIDSGFMIYRLYEVALGRLPLYNEFVPDMARLSHNGGTEPVEPENEQEYLLQFTNRLEFTTRFQGLLQPAQAAQLILKLEQTSGITLPETTSTRPGQPPQYGRTELINKRASGEFTVGQTLKAFVEQQPIYDYLFNRGEVTMMYFAYLRRDPSLNDPDLVGWKKWVNVFTNGGVRDDGTVIPPRDIHHLIFGFIYSEEYRKRFGSP